MACVPQLRRRVRQGITSLGSGLASDINTRSSCYSQDWRDVKKSKLRVLAAAVYIFLASALPALAFGVQMADETDQILNVVHVLVATAIGGVLQAVIGGQPLLIVGVAEPIVLVYMYMYRFAKDKEDLGPDKFLAWSAWTCVWAGIMVILLAVSNACVYIAKFTRFAGESFGALIALLFMQQAVKGVVNEFRHPEDIEPSIWRTINGLWALFLAFGMVLSGLAIRQGRRWRFLNSPLRAIAADYGVPILVIAWSGLSYALSGPSGVPSRVSAPNTWSVTSTWSVAGEMSKLPGKYIAAALIPGLIIAVLFYFDHNVSSQLAQQQEFNLHKGSAYHWDLLLLGIITITFGLIGLPPINGVIPQSPMHTKALSVVIGQKSKRVSSSHFEKGENKNKNASRKNIPGPPRGRGSLDKKTTSQLDLMENAETETARGKDRGQLAYSTRSVPPSNLSVVNTHKHDFLATAAADAAVFSQDVDAPYNNSTHNSTHSDQYGDDDLGNSGDVTVALSVAEQRGSGLLQSLGVGVCLTAMPAIRCIPTAVLWGYFAFMAAESLPGSQLWDRTLLLLTDPKRRYLILEKGHAPYLEIVKFRTIAAFTIVQLVAVGAVYGLTWAGIAGVLFPLPIMAMVPLRQYILPRIFTLEALEALDKMEEEEARPLEHDAAIVVATSAGLAPRSSLEIVHRVGSPISSEDGLDGEISHYRVIHHLSELELDHRRSAALIHRSGVTEGGGTGSAHPGSAGTAGGHHGSNV